MMIDLNTPILDFKSQPIRMSQEISDGFMTIEIVSIQALQNRLPNDDKLSDAERAAIFKLGIKVGKGGMVKMESAEIVLLRKRIDAAFTPMVSGRAGEILEGEATQAKEA